MLPQGTELFALVPSTDGTTSEVIKVDCAVSIDVGEDSRDDHEDTCLEERESHTFVPGLNTPGETSVTVRIDPSNPGHVRLEQFADSPQRLKWALGWSDGKEAAEVTAGPPADFELPKTRTWNVWDGHIKAFNFTGFEVGGDPVQGAITIKRSSKARWIVKTQAAPAP
ncbi:major tail subunit [Comamonas thiooxydans]|nr:major tail subunit [Comamonas thiooxydans]